MLNLLFPTPVYSAINTTALDSCRTLFSKCVMKDERISWPGYRTTLLDYNHRNTAVTWQVEDQEEAQPLIDVINSSVLNYADEYKLNPHEVHIDGIWLNAMEPKSTHPIHSHYGHTFSGVYYVDVPEGSGKITFYHHLVTAGSADLSSIKQITDFNSRSWWLPVEEGSIIIFPSDLKHGVAQLDYIGIRRSVSFNVSLVPIR